MLRAHLARRALERLEHGAARRAAAVTDPAALRAWGADVRAAVRAMLHLDGVSDAALRPRLVSRHERQHHLLENVIFESIDGWQTSATLFLPRGPSAGASPDRFPAVVAPCGHSAKTGPAHQLPPQVFARAGYAAIVFDPPAQGGEKGPGNDHFRDGPRCYAVGHTSQRYFVADALRAMDYLATRDDIDASPGFAMTGVSGGGQTTIFAALLDDRVRVAAPVCCATPQAAHPIGDLYAMCPETHPIGRLALGLDDADLMAAAAPRPQLYMAGAHDEVFTPEATRTVVTAVAAVYDAAGAGERFDSFIDDCGHDYTPRMARRFVAFADRHLLGRPERRHADAFHHDPQPEPAEAMRCSPAPEPNMRTITAARAEALRHARPRLTGRADAARVVRATVPGVDEARIERVERRKPVRAFADQLHELLLFHERDVALPATLLRPGGGRRGGGDGEAPTAAPAVVAFDDRGRWAPLQQHGWLAAVSRYTEAAAPRPAVLSVDLRGWGDTQPAPAVFELTSWSGPDRWPSYIAAALDDGLLAQRTRDAVAAVRWLANEPGIDAARLVLAGRGLGGIVALMAAALTGRVAGVVCIDTPSSIEAVVAAERYGYGVEVFLPRVLERFDLQPLAEAVAPVLWVRPCDELARLLRDEPDSVAVSWVWQRLGV